MDSKIIRIVAAIEDLKSSVGIEDKVTVSLSHRDFTELRSIVVAQRDLISMVHQGAHLEKCDWIELAGFHFKSTGYNPKK